MFTLKNKTSLFIGIGCCIFLSGVFLTSDFQIDNNLSQKDSLRFWIYSIIRDSGLVIIISTLIISGLRIYRVKGIKSKGVILLFIGLFLNIGLAVFSAYSYTKVKYVSENLFENADVIIQKMLKKLDENDLSEKQRISLNEILAQEYYVKHGKLIDVIDENGEQKVYEPTQKDVEFKKEYELGKQRMEWLKKSFYRAVYLWSIILVVSIITGSFVPIRRNNISPS